MTRSSTNPYVIADIEPTINLAQAARQVRDSAVARPRMIASTLMINARRERSVYANALIRKSFRRLMLMLNPAQLRVAQSMARLQRA